MNFEWEMIGVGTFEQKSDVVGKYIPPKDIEGDSELVIITLIVTDNQERSLYERVVLSIKKPLTIEAEECKNFQGCESQGWTFWDSPSCSGGRCITNVDTQNSGQSVNAAFSLPFNGKGLWIVYRQDIWYGELRVEIDGEVIAELSQSGTAVVSQQKVCYEVEQGGDHHLFLGASDQDGIVTLDAFKIIPPSQGCP